MKIRYILCILFLLILIPFLLFSQEKNAIGTWQGALSVQGMNLHIVFKIAKDDKGLHATMDSPDQGAKDIPCDTVILSGKKLTIGMKAIGGEYVGSFSSDTSVTGNWSQGGSSLALNLSRTEKPVEVNRPQEPKPPYPYNEEEVSYRNNEQGDTLAGTLTTPKTGGPFPVALLITGSGPQDRNETLMGHKPFLVLSDYLTRQGVAVLRVDDRGMGKSTGSSRNCTTRDFATDVKAGIEFLKTRKEIDHSKIGLIGHSEGGVIAPMVAAESPDVAFIVMMAGTGVPGDQLMLAQSAAINKAGGMNEELLKKDREINSRMFDIIEHEPDTAAAAKKLMDAGHDEMKKLTDQQMKDLGLTDQMLPAMIQQLNSPWVRYFLTYDPRPALTKVKCPVLALNGEKDTQVLPDLDLPEIEKALKEGGNNHFAFEKLPGLNHLFQTCDTGSPAEYGKIEETMSPVALKKIGDWLLETVK